MSSLNLLKVEATSAGLTNAAYAVGEVLGNEMQWDMGTGTYGLVVSAKLTDTADVIGAVDLYLFDRSVRSAPTTRSRRSPTPTSCSSSARSASPLPTIWAVAGWRRSTRSGSGSKPTPQGSSTGGW